PVMRYCRLLLLCALAVPLPSYAQDSDTVNKLERLQRDVQLLQRQIARGEAVTGLDMGDVDASSAAKIEVRLSAIDEELRDMRGRVEESEFQLRKLTETLDKLKADTEFRFQEL